MPLSEHEQRILDEIERKLAEEDPKFARGVTASTPRGRTVRRLKRAVAGFVLGIALLLVALLAQRVLLIGIPAFIVMLSSAVVIATSAKHLGAARETATGENWMTRMEMRWKKRFDREDG